MSAVTFKRPTRENMALLAPFAKRVKRLMKDVQSIAADESQSKAARVQELELIARDIALIADQLRASMDADERYDLITMR